VVAGPVLAWQDRCCRLAGCDSWILWRPQWVLLPGFVQAALQRSCPDTTPPPDASTTFASPAN